MRNFAIFPRISSKLKHTNFHTVWVPSEYFGEKTYTNHRLSLGQRVAAHSLLSGVGSATLRQAHSPTPE